MEIEFGGTYTQKQVRQAVTLLSKPTSWWGWIRRSVGPVVILFILGMLLYALITGEEIRAYSLVRAGTLILLGGYYTASPYLTANRLSKQLWERLERQGVQQGAANGRGVAWQGLFGSNETGWEKFARLREDETLLNLITEDGTLHIFPRAFFRSDEDWVRFRQMAHQRVKVIH